MVIQKKKSTKNTKESKKIEKKSVEKVEKETSKEKEQEKVNWKPVAKDKTDGNDNFFAKITDFFGF